jgi:hypothetical protein
MVVRRTIDTTSAKLSEQWADNKLARWSLRLLLVAFACSGGRTGHNNLFVPAPFDSVEEAFGSFHHLLRSPSGCYRPAPRHLRHTASVSGPFQPVRGLVRHSCAVLVLGRVC